MKEILAKNLFNASTHLERIDVLVDEWERPSRENVDESASQSLRINIAKTYEAVAKSAEALDAPVTKIAAKRAGKKLRARKTPLTFREIGAINKEVMSRLEDEMASVRFYCLPRGARRYYSPPEPLFGLEVEARIPEGADDISEAGKCFAVGRYTASAFHLMRAMECGVQRIADALNISNLDRVWGNLLSDIARAVELLPKGTARDKWSATVSLLYHVKQAWRNDTMHPKRTYTEEEAREVFEAVKAFMRHLAGMLPGDEFEELLNG